MQRYQDILYSVEDHVATITINRPEKMNAVTAETLNEIENALDEAGRDNAVGVIVLTGSVKKHSASEQISTGKRPARWEDRKQTISHLRIS